MMARILADDPDFKFPEFSQPCTCGMPLCNEDIRLRPIDEWESRIFLRCQHCGTESVLMFQLQHTEPGYNARIVL